MIQQKQIRRQSNSLENAHAKEEISRIYYDSERCLEKTYKKKIKRINLVSSQDSYMASHCISSPPIGLPPITKAMSLQEPARCCNFLFYVILLQASKQYWNLFYCSISFILSYMCGRLYTQVLGAIND